ncbi:restriction endonuclease [Virgibacillus halodenitrificans]|uniref:restriction endonuclease n=1 Tax=Virgibacillus halodenitrificans TaxID=1482 RepID=UPI0002EC96FF|nr:restriction endonuclease [Virgibacillus halodenitrificans]
MDLEEYIYDQISERIIQRFKGYKMESLIEEILKAKGFTTYRGPEGADNGVDILAASDTLGFGNPRICVQVKTSDSPLDRPTLDQLIGTMSNFSADFGLLVSWSGFKSSVTKEITKKFFKVRLWDSKTIIQQIFENYEKLSDEIKKEIPIKMVWMLDSEVE